MSLLRATDLVYVAGCKRILDGITLSLNAGESIAVVGPNGAGKSTLLRLLSGELRAHSGEILLRDRPLARYGSRELAQHRAVLSQSITVAFSFTVAEVVGMGAGDRHGAKIDALTEQALDEVDLAPLANRVFTTLSGGEQQRAHFARILVQIACGEAEHGPGVLLLDEPTASLDLKHQLTLAASARRCSARGLGVLAIVHDLNLATLFADRLVVLSAGRVYRDGSPAEVICEDVLENVFGVRSAVGQVPSAMPFVLPHSARPMGT